MTTIAVVTRCHNQGAFLEEAVLSALRQSRPPDKLIIVEDGSTDGSSAVARQLTAMHERVELVERTPARGPAASFNDGVLATASDLVVALDADDRFGEDYLKRCEFALASSSADFAYGGVRIFGDDDEVVDAHCFDADELMVENFVHVSALFRRWVFDATGGFRRELDGLGLEDWEFWVHAVDLGARGVPVSDCFLEYRRSGGGRNAIGRVTAMQAHVLVHRMHPSSVRRRHLVRWAARSINRNARKLVR